MNNSNIQTEQPKTQKQTFCENFNVNLATNTCYITRKAYKCWSYSDVKEYGKDFEYGGSKGCSTSLCLTCTSFLFFSAAIECVSMPVTLCVSAIQACFGKEEQNQDQEHSERCW